MKLPRRYRRLVSALRVLDWEAKSLRRSDNAPMTTAQQSLIKVLTHKRYDRRQITAEQADKIILALLARLPDVQQAHAAAHAKALAETLNLHSLQNRLNGWWSTDRNNTDTPTDTVVRIRKDTWYYRVLKETGAHLKPSKKEALLILPFRTNDAAAAATYIKAYEQNIYDSLGECFAERETDGD